MHDNIQLWTITLTLIKFSPAPFLHFLLCAHALVRPRANCGGEIKFSAIMEMVYPPPPDRHRTSSSPLSGCESISGSLKTCQMCSDQCNGLRVHYIHSAPFYEVTSWRGLPARALCRAVNQAGRGEWGGRGVDRWIKGDGSQAFLGAMLG